MSRIGLLAVAGLAFAPATTSGQAPSDVPASHWAASHVRAVVETGVMPLSGGRFDGGRKVSRTELIGILARLAKTLEARRWPSTQPAVVENPRKAPGWEGRPVTRYEAAAVIDKVSRDVLAGLPKARQPVGETEALPKATLAGISPSNPSYASLKYLVDNRMVWPNSVLLKPGPQPVTGKDFTLVLASMVAGLNDRLTDEPQNKTNLGPPPAKKP